MAFSDQPLPPPLPRRGRRSVASRRPARRAKAPSLWRRLRMALGPVLGGILIDLIDLTALGPAGFLIGGIVGFALAGVYGARPRQRLLVAVLAALYCTNLFPALRFVPLATLVGAWVRFRETGPAAEHADGAAVREVSRMNMIGDGDDAGGAPRTAPTGGRRGSPASFVMTLLVVAIALLPAYVWFFCRIEPRQGMIAVLTHKTGRDLPSGQILALDKAEKGIQLAVLSEGRYFRNPYSWQWKLHPIVDIPSGKLGVQTRLYGTDLPPGRILASDGAKGILPDILGPGKHRINPYAYQVDIHDAINIRAGYVGVKTLLVGDDVLHDSLPADQRNSFLVAATSKGVVDEVLDPGTYYLNPFVVNVVEVNLQSQRFEMSGEDAINFLTLDGFTISVEGTIEFGIEREKAALITHRVGDMEDVITKIILPRARGFSRIEGSKYPAIDFIVGETRQRFQRQLEEHLRKNSVEWGVAIKSVLIRKIVVPDEIASISRDREIAVQDARKFEQQTEQAKSKAELVRQETLALQNKVKVEVETERIRALIAANQDQLVQVIAAQRELGVAKLDNQSAVFQAEAVLAKAAGDRDAVKATNMAEAAVLRAEVEALGAGADLARYTFYRAVAPRIETVLASDRADSLGGLFAPFMPPAAQPSGPRAPKEVTP